MKRKGTEFQELEDFLQNQIITKKKDGTLKNEELEKVNINGLLIAPYNAINQEGNSVKLAEYWDTMFDIINGRTKFPPGKYPVFSWQHLKESILKLPLAKETIAKLMADYDQVFHSYQEEAKIYQAKLKADNNPIHGYDPNNKADHGRDIINPKDHPSELPPPPPPKKETEVPPWYAFNVQDLQDFGDAFIYGLSHPIQNVSNIVNDNYDSLEKWEKSGKDHSLVDVITGNISDVISLATGISIDKQNIVWLGLAVLGGSLIVIKVIKSI